MISRWLRTYMHVLRPLLLFLARLGFTPNLLTLISFAAIVISGLLLAERHWTLGGAVLLFGALLDAVDGELARVLKRENPMGGLLDSLADHCGDLAVFLGLLWHYLAAQSPGQVILIFTALFGSMLGSQIRSRAGMMGIETKKIGVFTRFERMLILVIGLFSGYVTAALWVLAVLNNFSAAQRVVYVIRMPFSSEKLAGLDT